LEGELVASMSHIRSLCLYGEGTKLARVDEGFAMCKTYEQWIGGGDQVSYRQELSNQLLIYTNGIMGEIGDPTFRAKVILLENSTKIDQKASFMWAIFQTHQEIKSFITVQFKSHPAIVK
jgi:hypothetical protein